MNKIRKFSIKNPPKIFGFSDREEQPCHVRLVDYADPKQSNDDRNDATDEWGEPIDNPLVNTTSTPVGNNTDNGNGNVVDLMPKINAAREDKIRNLNLLQRLGRKAIDYLKPVESTNKTS